MKKHIKRTVNIFHSITFWQLLLTLVILLPLSLVSLRHNNQKMGELKQAVVEADKAGGQKKIEAALSDLSMYVFDHMNTSTQIELAETYNRRVVQLQEKASKQQLTNDKLFDDARQACINQPAAAQLECVQKYVIDNSVESVDLLDIEYPEKSTYTFAFAAPRWSRDLAGLSLLGCVVSLVLIAIKFIHKKIRPS